MKKILICLYFLIYSTIVSANSEIVSLICTSSDRSISWSVTIFSLGGYISADVNSDGKGVVEKTNDFYFVDYKIVSHPNIQAIIKINRTNGAFTHVWKGADFATTGHCIMSNPKF